MNRKQIAELSDLADIASEEPPFTKMSLDNLGNEEIIRRQLQVEIEKHIRAKESTQALVDRIQKVTGVSLNRAMTAAQTEKTRAVNGNRYAQVIRKYLADYEKSVKGHRKRPALPEGQWIDPRVAKEPRPEHVAISGTIRPVGEEFLPGLRFPGDPQAPPRQTIRCHCYWRRVR